MGAERSIDFDAIEAREDTWAGLPRHLRWASFQSPKLRERVKPRTAVTKAFAITSGPVVLTGKAGSGKTSLGIALMRSFASRLGKVGVFADAIELAHARRNHPLGDGEAPAVIVATTAEVLFLDELGAEQGIDQTIDEIIRARYNHERPTIIGTPHPFPVLRARYGDGVCRRIYENATILKLEGAA